MVAWTTPVGERRLRQLEPHERFGIDRRAELADRHSAREVRRGRREQIAAVKGARDRLERVGGVRELVGVVDPRALGRRQQQAVVRPHEATAFRVTQGERAAVAADTRIDHREMNADGHVRQRVGEDERPLQHRLRRDPMRDVDDLGIRCEALDHAVAGADEVVLEPEIGEERDEHASLRV